MLFYISYGNQDRNVAQLCLPFHGRNVRKLQNIAIYTNVTVSRI